MNSAQKDYTHTVLVAIINNLTDFARAQVGGWYRIPTDKAPPIVKSGRIKLLAFYHTGRFKKEKFSIRYYASVLSVEEAERRVLFPLEPENVKSGKRYYKINLSELRALPQPIVSLRQRRILFITTTAKKLYESKEIEELFAGDPAHNKIVDMLENQNIAAERGFILRHRKQELKMDFAIFCREKNICLEPIKGNSDPADPESEARIIRLEKMGWSVFKVPLDSPKQEFEQHIVRLMEQIDNYGGLS
ncbi:MAG: hypothetical protein V4543_06000 [Bacteroidota bacterium]